MKLILLSLCLILTGCAHQTTNVASAPGESRIGATDGVDCRIAPGVASRVEPLWDAGTPSGRIDVATGPVWGRVFVGGSDAPAILELDDTRFAEDLAGGGFTIRNTYTVRATLRLGGRSWPIFASGTRAAYLSRESCRRQAVELAVVDAAAQVKAIMRSESATK